MTCPRCGDRLNVEVEKGGYKILDAWCENEDCTLGDCSPARAVALTDAEYSTLSANWWADRCDAAYEQMRDR